MRHKKPSIEQIDTILENETDPPECSFRVDYDKDDQRGEIYQKLKFGFYLVSDSSTSVAYTAYCDQILWIEERI